MPLIHSVQTTFPDNTVSQDEIRSTVAALWPDKADFINQFFHSSGVRKRHLSLPLGQYQAMGHFGEKNLKWKQTALELQSKNIEKILSTTKCDSDAIRLIASVNTTGMCVPSLEALLINKVALSVKTKRLPVFGLGCLGGVAGMNRVNDYLIGHPKEAALVLVTELCSLTFQLQDHSVPNLIGTALFGDGAGAVLMVGREHKLADESAFEIMNCQSIFYPDTERLMGWDMIESGFQIVLSPDIPALVREHVGKNVEEFIYQCGVERKDIDFFVAHPGGPKVLDAMMETLNLTREDIFHSWESLGDYGNMSAVSVVDVLKRTIGREDIKKGSLGVMLAMGPAFSLEMALVKKC